MTDWEHGRRYPTAAEALRACGRVGIDVGAAFSHFHAAAAPGVDGASVAAWLNTVRGSLPISELAVRTGRSRFAVARWLKGQAEPRVPDFFRLVEAMTGRLPDLIAGLVPIEAVPELLARFRAADAARRLAFEEPWTEAVLRLLETTAYAASDEDPAAFIARRLGTGRQEVGRALLRLEQAGLVQREPCEANGQHAQGAQGAGGAGGRHRVAGNLTVDTASDPRAARDHMARWSAVAFEHFGQRGARNLFAYNVVSLSEADLSRVRELLRSTYREVRAIVAASEPSETAALLNLQLVEFVEPLPSRSSEEPGPGAGLDR